MLNMKHNKNAVFHKIEQFFDISNKTLYLWLYKFINSIINQSFSIGTYQIKYAIRVFCSFLLTHPRINKSCILCKC